MSSSDQPQTLQYPTNSMSTSNLHEFADYGESPSHTGFLFHLGLSGGHNSFLIQMCNTNGEDASIKPIWYKNGNMEVVRAFDVVTINCVIGWVKPGKWWGIVDHSAGPPQITICDIQELEYELEDSFSISCSV